jgi:hypothetical protein
MEARLENTLPKGWGLESPLEKEAGLENTLPKVWGLEGPLKREAELENTLPKVWGLEGPLKRRQIGLESTLPKMWGLKGPLNQEVMVRHWYVKDESNVSWSICMYTYLRSVGPLSSWSSLFYMEFSFLHGVLIFSKVWVSDSKLRWLFSLLLTRVISCDIDPWERLDMIILLCPPPLYLKSCQFCPIVS